MSEKLANRVSEEIERKGRGPLPRWVFLVVHGVVWVLVGVLAVLGGVVLALAVNVVRAEEVGFLFGVLPVLRVVFGVLPIVWLVVLVVVMLLTVWLSRQVGEGYRRGTGWWLSVIGGGVLGVGLVLVVGFSPGEFLQMVYERFPVAERIGGPREGFLFDDEGVVGGRVIEVGDGEILVETPIGDGVVVKGDLPDEVEVGMRVRAVGELEDGVFVAEDVRVLPRLRPRGGGGPGRPPSR